MKKAVEIIKTYSYRSLYNNKIEQLPRGIFSNLSELRYLQVGTLLDCLLLINKTKRVVCESNHTYKNPSGFKTYAASMQRNIKPDKYTLMKHEIM